MQEENIAKMKKDRNKAMPKVGLAVATEAVKNAEAPIEFTSPPCYAHEFPGYFGETETAAPADKKLRRKR